MAHGRSRDISSDELYFGPFRQMVRASMKKPRTGAQWTGITTRIGEVLLERQLVDAVLAVGPDPKDRWKPEPRLITTPEEMSQCRGMRMGYAPLLALLEPAAAQGHKRLAIIGIPCQVHALRALEAELGLERLYIIGIPCSDNTSTENFHIFLNALDENPESICYLEFKPDYRVELRYDDGHKREIPFLNLPLSDLPKDFFPLTCRTCVDYTNALADITVGYMAGDGQQWLIVRNERGEELLSFIKNELELSTLTDAGKRQGAVSGFLSNLKRSTNGLPLRRIPRLLRPLVSFLQPRTGPRGLEFARTRVEMKALETILHLKRYAPRRMQTMIPDHIWKLTAPYDIDRQPLEREQPSAD